MISSAQILNVETKMKEKAMPLLHFVIVISVFQHTLKGQNPSVSHAAFVETRKKNVNPLNEVSELV